MTIQRDLLYILAPSFSGSTLLTYLLAQHSEIATVGELKATQIGPVEDYRCSCSELMLDCNFWRSLRREAEAQGIEFSLDDFGTVFDGHGRMSDKVIRASVRGQLFERIRSFALHTIPGANSRLAKIADRNRQLADIVCVLQGSRVFLDGSKDATRLLHLINSGRWNVKVIYLQRDGRGVSSSIKKHQGLHFEGAVWEWQHSITELQNMRQRLDPASVFDLRYEDLCNEPAVNLNRIFQWLDIESLDVRGTHFKAGEYHILGNAMRLNQITEVRLDEKWKMQLAEKDLQVFEAKAGPLNRRLGYV